MPKELRLSRFDNNLCDLHRLLPRGSRVFYVRYTSTELVCVYS